MSWKIKEGFEAKGDQPKAVKEIISRINNNEKLDDEEKIQLQQYITRIYGSLTTFNVMFSDKIDYFIGEKGK